LAVEDKSFNLCALKKQEECDEGGAQTEDSLMSLAKNKFTLHKDAGRHNRPSAEEERSLPFKLNLNKSARGGTKRRRGMSSKRLKPRKRGT
jgi:hypothetical protein